MPVQSPNEAQIEDWRGQIRATTFTQSDPVTAHTFLKGKSGYSKAGVYDCADGNRYIVKPFIKGRPLFTEQVAAILGHELNAPIPPVTLVTIPQDLIDATDWLNKNKAQAGPAHGSLELPEAGEKMTDFAYADQLDNRDRYARLAVLYGWLHAGDAQVIYEKTHQDGKISYRIYSVDHGHFMEGPDWNRQKLLQLANPTPFSRIVTTCRLEDGDLKAPIQELSQISNDKIAEAVARPPQQWGIDETDRIYVAHYLSQRRDQIAQHFLSAT